MCSRSPRSRRRARPGSRAPRRGDGHDTTPRPDAAHDSPAGPALRGPAPGALPARSCAPRLRPGSRSCLRRVLLRNPMGPGAGRGRLRPVPRRPHAAHVRHRLRARRGRGARCRAPRQPHGGPLARARRRGEAARPCGARRGRAGRGARRVRGRARRRRAPAARARSACGRLGGHRAGQPAPLRAGARRGPAPRPQRRYRRRRGGDAPRVLLSGRTCARPHDRRAHRCPGDAPELGAARLARAPGVARGRGLHRRRTRGGPSPHDCARWPRAHPGSRRRPSRLVLPLRGREGRCVGSRSPPCSPSSPQRSSWAGMPCSTPAGGRRRARSPTACCPTLRSPCGRPRPRLRAGLWTAERGASTMPTGVSGGRTWRGYWQWMMSGRSSTRSRASSAATATRSSRQRTRRRSRGRTSRASTSCSATS
ncbi:hypothetical protein COLAER_00677 [Collinsella aerofaciens ATCC 25986]|uniref:Uncharacterized protein n=1 Tax=Collinsella aerofaciens (strain ATCC 25986 / DSM 3979 / JCM 10188 / KCTC 3647 / NCTC 11838 / VPI 1003) TaxID=411903 RepID=A4E8D8_COLAA|nr:hypothetical protein COLAER_00677 [Collinsella aerofaciens ATCC 25986]